MQRFPQWTAAIGSQAEAEAELVGHIRQTVTRYAGVIPTWDVVKEPIPDRPTSVRDLRESLWTKQIGPDYMPLAFKTAHACDPSARLFINDYDIEYEDARSQAKRDAFLALLRRLKDDNVLGDSPINILGFRSTISDRTPCRIGHCPRDRDMQVEPIRSCLSSSRDAGRDDRS